MRVFNWFSPNPSDGKIDKQILIGTKLILGRDAFHIDVVGSDICHLIGLDVYKILKKYFF